MYVRKKNICQLQKCFAKISGLLPFFSLYHRIEQELVANRHDWKIFCLCEQFMRSQGIVHAMNDVSFDDLFGGGGALSGTLAVHGVSLQTCQNASP